MPLLSDNPVSNKSSARNRKSFQRRIAKISLVFVAICSAGWAYFHFYNRVYFEDIDRIYGPLNGWSSERKGKYFAQTFPSSSEITEYVQDLTVLHSHPPIGNDVFYFDTGHQLILWRDWGYRDWRGHSTEVGTWWLEPYLYCHYIKDLKGVLSYDKPEYRRGNVFGLSASHDPPFRLPNTEITIDSLLL
jgi:hypothetical protein